MPKLLCAIFVVLWLFLLTTSSYAQQGVGENEKVEEIAKIVERAETAETAEILVAAPVIIPPPEVGKHVMANTDAGSMILSLLMVLALIFISALVLKRFNFTQQQSGQLKVVASLSLGTKERIIVAQVGDQQLVLGITPQQITLIKSLEEPIASSQTEKPSAFSGNVLAFFKKN